MPAQFCKLEVSMEENVLGVGTSGPSHDAGSASCYEAVLGNREGPSAPVRGGGREWMDSE